MGSPTPAGQAEIIRCAKKDEQYIHQLRADVNEVFLQCFGIKKWMQAKPTLDIVSDLTYFALTTIAGFQSLGEEYVNLIQVDSSFKKVPSFLKRTASVLLQTASPLLLNLAITRLEKTLISNPKILPHFTVSCGSLQLNTSTHLIPALRQLVTLLPKLNLLLFYFFGTFYHFSKRVTNIRYVLLRRWLKDASSLRLYKVLGWISLTHFVLSLGLEAYNYHLTTSGASFKYMTDEDINQDCPSDTHPSRESTSIICTQDQICRLCLEKRQHSTLTPCGHLFCWGCIFQWMETKWECPLCRTKFPASRLVFLQNFD